MPDIDPAAILAGIRAELRTFGATYADESRLLAAVEAALKLADDWRAVGCPESTEEEALMWHRIEDGEALREATSSALTGTQLDEDGKHDR